MAYDPRLIYRLRTEGRVWIYATRGVVLISTPYMRLIYVELAFNSRYDAIWDFFGKTWMVVGSTGFTRGVEPAPQSYPP